MDLLGKPETVKMEIHSGILESLGINMYTSIAKSLVEFVANAFDAEATSVDIKIPFEEIQNELALKAKKTSKDEKDMFENEFSSLDKKIEIVISDNGHGMTFEEIENNFLPINRNRREVNKTNKSESNKRTVMGRKGLGKLAGFGAAEIVSVWSTRKGEPYATEILMDFNEIGKKDKMHEVEIPAMRIRCSEEEHGTKITLCNLRGDSVKSNKAIIMSRIARNFFITGDDFGVYLNNELIKEEEAEYEFCYPINDPDKLAQEEVIVNEDVKYPISYIVKFRARIEGKRAPLAVAMRGARIYCNQRLAAGPTMLDLETGMHNFHSQSYMECIVHADALDQSKIDLIGTNRSDIKADNSIVQEFRKKVTELMKDALREHGKFRERVIEQKLEDDEVSSKILDSISALSSKHRGPAMRVLKTLALSSEGIGSDTYKEVAPMFVMAINSSEILVELIKTGMNPKDMTTIIQQLANLSEMENGDIIKLYKGRHNAILGLEKLQEKMHGNHPKEENKLHQLLKNNPWLIKPEYERFLTSDQSLSTVAKELTSVLKIDTEAPEHMKNDRKRPDLVFVATDTTQESHACIIELKAVNKPLENDDLVQLQSYMSLTKQWLEDNNKMTCKVTGCLIGNIEASKTNFWLKDRIQEAGPGAKWEVITIPDLLIRAKQVHYAGIEILEKTEEENGESLNS